MTEADIGRPVAVREVSTARASIDRTLRVDDTPNGWGLLLILPLFLLSLYFLLQPVLDVGRIVIGLWRRTTGRS
jgi:hypothetical protein